MNPMVALLREGELTLRGLLPWSSNYAFLGQVSEGDQRAVVVYKPIRGERPLWDFPRGTLAKREVAAFEVSQALGWEFVPPTILRDGPHGIGSVQLFVNADQEAHFFTLHQDPAFQHALQSLALFDIVVNNADRKGGHCLKAGHGRIIAIDHGICFHAEPKLRTVIWDFAGQPIPADLLADLRRLRADFGQPSPSARTAWPPAPATSAARLGPAGRAATSAARLGPGVTSPISRALRPLLAPAEIAALLARLDALLTAGIFPNPPEDRRPYPWPLV
jgi:uncharacterized repeat protein (TIGR03843 family)